MQLSTDSFKYHIQNFNKDEFGKLLLKIDSGQLNGKKLVKLFSKSIQYLEVSTYPDPKALYILELAKKTLQKMENAPQTLQEQFFQAQHRACFKQFTDCPWEVDQHIFSFLDPRSLFCVYSVCKAFQSLAKEVYEDTFALQRTILNTLFQGPENLSKRRYTAPLSLDFSFTDMSQATMLVPSENGQLPLFSVFPNISHLNLERIKGLPGGVTITSLLDQCNNLRSLKIELSKEFCKEESPEGILQSIAKKSELRTLNLCISYPEQDPSQYRAKSFRLLLNSCPKLEEVHLSDGLDKDFFIEFTDAANEGHIYPQIKNLAFNATNCTAHQIAQFLTCFPHIQTLKISAGKNVEFNDELLNVLKSNESLVSLRLSGTFTDEFIEQLSKIEELQELDLNSKKYTEKLSEGFQHFSKLQKLQKLTLENFSLPFESILTVLESCDALHTLEMYECSCLSQGPVFSDESKTGISLKTLKIIGARDLAIESARLLYFIIRKADTLESIDFKQMQILATDDGIYKEIMAAIGKLQSLHTVKFETNGVDYFTLVDGLDTIPTLKDITICSDVKEKRGILQTAIHGIEIITSFFTVEKRTFNFPLSLEKVCLVGSGVTQEVFDGLIRCCDQVRELTLTRISVRGESLRELAKFKKLKTLSITSITMTSETILYLLQNLPFLELLHLDLDNPVEINVQVMLPYLKKVFLRSKNTKERQFQEIEKFLAHCPNLTEIGIIDDVERLLNTVLPSSNNRVSKFEELEKKYPAVRFL